MNYKSDVEPLYDVGPPYVSPREGAANGVPEPPAEGTSEDKNLVIEALTVREFINKGVWPSWFMKKHDLPEKYGDLPIWLRKAIEEGYDETYKDELRSEIYQKYGVIRADLRLTAAQLPRLAARLVRMDHWADLCQYIETSLTERGYRLKNTESEIDSPDIEFVEQIACTAETHQEISAKFEECFQAKYHYKMLRPVAKILKWLQIDTEHKKVFHKTIQEYDHPGHYSYPAGHGTDAGATIKGVLERWEIPKEVEKEIVDGCRAFAHFRTWAFMHTSNENEEGVKLGRK